MTAKELFDLVERLGDGAPFRSGRVAELTGASLARDDAASTRFFAVHESRGPAGPFGRVEVREPAEGKGGLVLLEIGGGLAVTRDEVAARYGDQTRPDVPSPHGPPDPLRWLTFSRPWGELRVGLDGEPPRVRQIVLDATGR